MAKEEVKTEETKVEATETTGTDVISPEVMDAMKAFDAKIAGDDDSAGEEEASEEKTPEEKVAEEEAAKTKPAGEKEAAKEVDDKEAAKDRQIDDEANAIEQQIIADDAKTTEKEVVVEKKAVDEKPTEDDKPFDCGLDPEEYDEGLIKSVNTLGQNLTTEIKTLKSEKAELQYVLAQQANARYGEWLDRKINSLGEQFHEVLGEGDGEDLEPDSAHLENRIAISRRIGLISQAYQKMGKPIPPRSKLFEKAVAYLHKDLINKPEKDAETVKKLAERKSQTIGRAKQTGTAQTAMERSKQVLDDFDKKIASDT